MCILSYMYRYVNRFFYAATGAAWQSVQPPVKVKARILFALNGCRLASTNLIANLIVKTNIIVS